LTKSERDQFAELATQAAHLRPADAPLLAALAQTILLARKLARDPSKVSEWEKAVRAQAMLSRSLRMTPQSRIDARAAGRGPLSQPSAYDRIRMEHADAGET
jgi:hypothetical protein